MALRLALASSSLSRVACLWSILVGGGQQKQVDLKQSGEGER